MIQSIEDLQEANSPWAAVNFPVYSSSTAALNMLTVQYAAAFPRMGINSVDPGCVPERKG